MSSTKPISDDIADRIRDPRLSKLYEYWTNRRGARRFPARRDIDPLDLRYVLGSIMLVDVNPKPPRYRVRLHGSTLVLRAGYDLTGKLLDDIPVSEYRAYVLERCDDIIRAPRPVAVQHNRVLDSETRRYEALWLPFAEDDQNVSLLLCALLYDTL